MPAISDRVTRARLARVLLTACLALVALLAAASPASAAFGLTKLHVGTAAGAENYAFTAGDTIAPDGSTDANKWHRMIYTDSAGVVRYQSACASNGGGGAFSDGDYVIPADAPTSTDTSWTAELQQYTASDCSGAPAKIAARYFTIASLTLYSSSTLTNAAASITPGGKAYITVAGMGVANNGASPSPVLTATPDWSVTWIKPDGSTSCANTGAADRPGSTAGGALPDTASSFLQYRPNSTATGDQWNRESQYETKPCADTTTTGQWQVKLQRDATHFVTLNAFVVSSLTAPTINSGPTTPGGDRQPSWSFSGGGGTGHDCRLTQGATVVSDWAPCLSPKTYDLTGHPEGSYTFAVRATQPGQTGPVTTSDYLLDTTPPAAPTIDSNPGVTGSGPNPSWSFTGEVGASFSCRLDGPAGYTTGWGTCAAAANYDLTSQADGTYTFSVKATDAANLTSPTTTSSYVLDRTAPVPPTITSHPLAADDDANPAWGFTAEPGTAVWCRLSRGLSIISDWTVCTSPTSYALAGQADGAYTFSAYAVDAAGNVGAPVVSSYTLDRSAPVAPTFTATPPATGTSTSPQWSFSGEGGATLECRLQRDGVTVDDWASCSSPDTRTLTTDGSYAFSVRATDAAGNVGAVATSTYVLDRAAPAQPTITSAPASPDHQTSVSLGFSGEAGATFTCDVDGPGSYSSGWAACTSPKPITLAQGDGAYTLSVKATDAAGNTSTAATASYTLDTAAPGAPAITAHPLAADDDPDPSWTAAGDPGTAIQCRLERGVTVISDWTVCPGGVGSYHLTTNGTYTFSARAVDAAGNIGAATTSNYVFDNVAPAAPVITNPPASPGPSPSVSWGFSGEAGATFTCNVDGPNGWSSGWGSCASPNARTLTDGDGSYLFSVKATDAAGNVSAAATHTFVLDSTAPGAATITSAPSSPGHDTNVSWSFTGDPGSTFECAIDHDGVSVQGFTSCASGDPVTLASGDGTYAFSVRAVDGVGNRGAAATSTYVLDTVNPGVPVITAHPLATDNDPRPSWTLTTDPSTAMWCKLTRGVTVISDWQVCTNPAAFDLDSESDGTYTFAAHAVDDAGNVSADVTDTYTLDRTAPAAPAFVSPPASPGHDASAQWAFTGEGGATFECRLERDGAVIDDWASCSSPDDPALTVDGTYEIGVRATDAAGNTGAAAFATYVLDSGTPGAPSFTATPSTPGLDSTPTWGFAGEAGATFSCKTDGPSGYTSGWGSCTSPATVDLGAQADGSYTFSVRQTDAAGNLGPIATSSYDLDRGAPNAPTITDHPLADDDDPTPSWTAATDPGNALQCRLDRGVTTVADWTVCTGPATYDLAAEPDGTYTFSVRAIDPSGNVGAATTSLYDLDRVAPAAPSLTGPATTPDNDAHPQWSFTGEAGATFDCRLTVDGSVVTDWTTCSTPQTPDLSSEADGSYTFAVRAIDAAGNTSPAATSTYDLDRAAPNAPSIDVAPPASGSDTHPSWEVSTDETGATIECRTSRDGTFLGAWAACPSPHTEDLSSLGDAVYEVSFRVRDAAGNIGPAATSDYTLDTGADPAPTILTHPASPGHDSAPSWSFSGQAGSTFECHLSRNGTLVSDWAPCSSAKAYDVSALPDGTFTFSVRAVDAAGNRSAGALSDYELDRVAPAVPNITARPASPGTGATPSWSFTAEAGASTECRVDRGVTQIAGWAPCTTPRSYDLSASADGTYTFSVRAVDPAGNAGTAATATYTMDRTGPEAPAIVSGPPALSNTTRPSWTFSGESGAAFSCRLVREAIVVSDWAPCSGSKEYDVSTQPDGTYTFAVRATDGVGNVGAAASAAYVLDTTGGAPPRLDALPRSPGADRKPSWSFSGAAAGESYECRLDRGPTRVADWAPCASPQRYDLTGAPDAGYTFMVRAIDGAGNAGAAAAAAYDLDTTAPGPVKLKTSPPAADKDRSPSWTFSGEGGPLECRVARGAVTLADWATCTSPETVDLRSQPDGSYVLSVREADAAGNRSTPVTSKYRLDTSPPATPAVDPPAPRKDTDDKVGFSFATDDDTATFQCKLSQGDNVISDWSSCTSPKAYDLGAHPDGTYQFAVRATDAAGNTSDLGTRQYSLASQSPAAAPAAAAPAAPSEPSVTTKDAPAEKKDAAPKADAPAAETKPEAPAAPARPERAPARPAAAAPKPAPRHHDPKPHGAKKAVAAVGHVAAAAAKKVAQAAVVVAKNADKSVFPMSLIFIVVGFLGVQGRIDRSDPKLALVSDAAEDLAFGPPPTA